MSRFASCSCLPRFHVGHLGEPGSCTAGFPRNTAVYGLVAVGNCAVIRFLTVHAVNRDRYAQVLAAPPEQHRSRDMTELPRSILWLSRQLNLCTFAVTYRMEMQKTRRYLQETVRVIEKFLWFLRQHVIAACENASAFTDNLEPIQRTALR